jgi:actin-related protein 9
MLNSLQLSYSLYFADVCILKEFPARVGLRRNASSETLDDTLQANGTGGNNGETPASTSRASSLPQNTKSGASVNDYLVGTQLDEALAADHDISISWPFADGDVRDWTQAEAIWYVCRSLTFQNYILM